jgi:hypothetical protein
MTGYMIQHPNGSYLVQLRGRAQPKALKSMDRATKYATKDEAEDVLEYLGAIIGRGWERAAVVPR